MFSFLFRKRKASTPNGETAEQFIDRIARETGKPREEVLAKAALLSLGIKPSNL